MSLLVVLTLAKVAALWGRDLSWSGWTLIAFFWQDVAVAGAFIVVEQGVRRCRVGPVVMRFVYAGLVAWAALNVLVTRVLSTPVTWPMVRAARGALSDSLATYITWPHIVPVLLVLGVGAGLPVLLGRSRQRRPMLILAAVPIVIVGPGAVARTETAGLHRNPVVAMVASLLPRVDARVVVGDWRKPPFEAHDADDFSHLRGLVAGRNVVLVGLESTAAKHLRLYGASRDLTPHLDRLAEHAVIFERAYAVTPDSIRGLFSVLCSRYPAFDVPTDAYADVPCASMSETLRLAGYRTGLFHSGRFDYLGMNAVIRGRGFETLEDAADIGGQRESSFGVEEPATVARMLDWIDGLGGDEPFLLTYLPIAGHHPYEVAERGPFPDHDDEGRHRNAVHHGDKSLGALIDGLRARGLYDRTLWIVYGDHGQAFGDHPGNYGHTFFLYEENVRVPLIVALPGVIDRPRRSRTTASLVDIAPTLFDLLSIPHTEQHQGKSVLHPAARMALFFTDYSLSLVGLRDGRWKFIADLATGQSKLFDLESDPDERMTLSASYPERIARYEKTLRSWSAAQKADVTGDCPKFERPFTPAGSGRWHQRAGDRCRSILRRR